MVAAHARRREDRICEGTWSASAGWLRTGIRTVAGEDRNHCYSLPAREAVASVRRYDMARALAGPAKLGFEHLQELPCRHREGRGG